VPASKVINIPANRLKPLPLLALRLFSPVFPPCPPPSLFQLVLWGSKTVKYKLLRKNQIHAQGSQQIPKAIGTKTPHKCSPHNLIIGPFLKHNLPYQFLNLH
jgi:hypothetical protein